MPLLKKGKFIDYNDKTFPLSLKKFPNEIQNDETFFKKKLCRSNFSTRAYLTLQSCMYKKDFYPTGFSISFPQYVVVGPTEVNGACF